MQSYEFVPEGDLLWVLRLGVSATVQKPKKVSFVRWTSVVSVEMDIKNSISGMVGFALDVDVFGLDNINFVGH